VVLADEIPRLPSGKVLRRVLRERYGPPSDKGATPVPEERYGRPADG